MTEKQNDIFAHIVLGILSLAVILLVFFSSNSGSVISLLGVFVIAGIGLGVLMLIARAFLETRNVIHELDDFSKREQSADELRPDFMPLYAPMNSFAMRIEKLHNSKANQWILPPPMATQLIETYERQARSLRKVTARLNEIERLRIPLADGLAKLHSFNESNENAVSALQKLERNSAELLALQANIEQSSQKLEAILEAAETEAQKRALRAQVNHLAMTVSQSSAAHPPELALGAASYDLEQQITSEITHYMQMEQEVERQLA